MLARKYSYEEQQWAQPQREWQTEEQPELIRLQTQEARLIAKNSELKIEVDQLKGPERITSIAEKKLGMQVARSNIYVKAVKQ